MASIKNHYIIIQKADKMKLIRLNVLLDKLDLKLKFRIYKFQYIAKEKFYKVIGFILKFIA